MANTPPRPLIAGNWKMNGVRGEAVALARELARRVRSGAPGCDVVLCPPFPLLYPVAEAVAGSFIGLGGQDCHPAAAGPHTGDTSAAMLADAGCGYVIVGHSERRADHGEDDALVRAKARAAQDRGLIPIICIGETLDQRETGRTMEVVTGQLDGSLPEDAGAADVVIAYEPVWAIGTGRTASADQVARVHAGLRAELARRGGAAATARILYGGSVKPDNAGELLALDDVNGALVGGASLDADDFWAICRSCQRIFR